MPDWNDIRYVLEVLRTGSTLAASRRLKVSQSTVMRRIAALEEALAIDLFDKRRTGYVATEALCALLPRIEQIEATHLVFEAAASAIARDVSGTITLTAPEIVCSLFLNEAIAGIRRIHPAISIQVLASEKKLDLGNGEADIAIRVGARPTDGALFGRCLLRETWGFYCSKDYGARHGVPRRIEDLSEHAILGVQERNFPGPITEWLQRNLPQDCVVVRHSGLSPVYFGVRAGLGVSLLSDFLTAGDRDFVFCFAPEEFERMEVWLLAHERQRDTARVRVVMDFLCSHFSALLAGAVKAGTAEIF